MEATLDLTIEDIRTLRKLYIKLKQGESIFREKVLIPSLRPCWLSWKMRTFNRRTINGGLSALALSRGNLSMV